MEINFQHIYQGWRNKIFTPKDLKDFLDKLSKKRLDICRNCPMNTTPGKTGFFSFCRDCGCELQAKSYCTDCACPQGKWEAVASAEQDIEIHNAIDND